MRIVQKIKKGEEVDIKIMHEEVVEEKKIRKVKRLEYICNKIKKRLNDISKEKCVSAKMQITMNL
jgi:hypothetical protein